MDDFFAGHSHGPTPHLIDGCPLCDHLKAARDQAIERLAEAAHLLARLAPDGDRPTIRLNLAPIDLTADDTSRCHSIDLTAKLGEALSDAIDSMNAYARSERPATPAVEPANRESIGSGEWSAAAVAQCNPELYADVSDAFAELDPIEITDKVIRDRQADLPDVAQILDELYGDVPYPYDDEDVPLPHDQAHMDALTAEVENYLQDGDI